MNYRRSNTIVGLCLTGLFALNSIGIQAAENGDATKIDNSVRTPRKTVRAKGDITFDDLAFDIQKDGKFEDKMLTDDIKSLDKTDIKLRGYILPTSVFSQKGIKQFVLVRDNKECCFGPGAAIYDCVMVQMAEGHTTDFQTRLVTVSGKFHVDTETFVWPNGQHFAVYKITGQSVE